jgi:uncharacterized protein YggE
MKKYLFMAAFAGMAMAAAAQNKNWLDVPYVEVTGKAEMEVVPNEIFVDININEQNNSKKSVEQLEREMKAALQKIGVNVEKDLRVHDMSSALQEFWYKRDKINTSKDYQLLVRSAAELGKAFAAMEAVGISKIRVARVSHSDIEKLRREVKTNAAKDAKQKAADLTQAVGQTLGGCLHLQEIETFVPRPMRAMPMSKSATAFGVQSEQEPDLEFEKIKIEYSVAAQFAIK